MLIQSLVECIFSSISAVLRQPLGVWVYIYINKTILILPLGACIEIFIFDFDFIYYDFYNFRERCVTWHIQSDSHWAYGFIFPGTVLI